MGEQNSAAADEPADLTWRTSSVSGANDPNCVEAAFVDETVLVRDSKDRTRNIAWPRAGWDSFLARIEQAPAQ